MSDQRVVFVKTVRADGSSLYARESLRRTYEIGQRYTFPEKLPAHVGGQLGWYGSLKDDFLCNGGVFAGKRLLLCIGVIEGRSAPTCLVSSPFWTNFQRTTWQLTCTDFEVIGEVFIPKDWDDFKPLPSQDGYYVSEEAIQSFLETT